MIENLRERRYKIENATERERERCDCEFERDVIECVG